MADVRPFCAFRPRDDLAQRIIAPPYDVLSAAEAARLASDPLNFVHVTRSEVDLASGQDPHSPEAYQKARQNLDALVAQGAIVHDETPRYYFYTQTIGSRRQCGFLAACSVVEYDHGTIRRHELTRPDKEDDRMQHMLALRAQVGPVFLTCPGTPALLEWLGRADALDPAWRVLTPDGVAHALTPLPSDWNTGIQKAFSEIPALYVADGHHRSAAASRVHAVEQTALSSGFLAGIYPAEQLSILAYNRVVRDLNGLSSSDFLRAVDARFHRTRTDQPVPAKRGVVTMYFERVWFELSPRADLRIADDPVAALDVSVLQDHLLEPILGIADPRTSERIAFVGGIRGAAALEAAVDERAAVAGEEGAAVAFHLFPTGVDQLIAVADAGRMMPPKSTWFEPKLWEGVAYRGI